MRGKAEILAENAKKGQGRSEKELAEGMRLRTHHSDHSDNMRLLATPTTSILRRLPY